MRKSRIQLCNDFEIAQNSVSYPDMWHNAMQNMLQELSQLDSWDASKVAQIKEKFGGLRVYHMSTDSKWNKIIDKYDNVVSGICTTCGNTNEENKLNCEGWMSVKCETCNDLRKDKGIWGDIYDYFSEEYM